MRVTFRNLAATAAILAAAACGDSTVAPSSASSTLLPTDRAPSFDLSLAGNFGSDFTLTSRGGTFSVAGVYTVNFPANSVCDPATANYSAGQWDAPCATLAAGQSVKVHATLGLSWSGVSVDFQPELRFSPNATVTIATDIYAPIIVANRNYYAAHPQALGPLAMAYSSTLGGARVADYVTDPTAITHISLMTGRVWRRIKHFSGYNIFTGEQCTPTQYNSDWCVDVSGQQDQLTGP